MDHLARDQRDALAKLWLISARMEHASVAAFSQLSLHLAALGAPSELVERIHVAALDEIRHARRCYAIASAFAGKALTAGPIAEFAELGAFSAADLAAHGAIDQATLGDIAIARVAATRDRAQQLVGAMRPAQRAAA